MIQNRTERGTNLSWLHSLLPAVFFFIGTGLGVFCAGRISGDTEQELSAYLTDYLAVAQRQEGGCAVICSLALLYLRGPVLAFLCGFFPLGAVVLPLLAAAFGFLPAYAVGCLTASFGKQGMVMALAFFGLRCLITVPCFFLLAAPSMQTASARLRAVLGKGRSIRADSRGCWLRFAGVCLGLCIGICLDLRLSPFLLRVLLERFF